MQYIFRILLLISVIDIFICSVVAKRNVRTNADETPVYGNQKRSDDVVVNGETNDQRLNSPKYLKMAKDSLSLYLEQAQVEGKYKFKKIDNVSTQTVAGTITNIDFEIEPTNCQNDCGTHKCVSTTWEKEWEKFKEVNVTCDIVNNKNDNSNGPVLNGETEGNVNDPKYTALAKTSLRKYKLETGTQQPLHVVRITNVTEQVVAGKLIQIDFDASNDYQEIFKCHSKIYQQPWQKKQQITVNCSPNTSR